MPSSVPPAPPSPPAPGGELPAAARWAVRAPWIVAWGGLAAATVLGAGALAFLCDDAFIHFRYAANAHAGLGIVWNPPPFEPVEGAGFLWVLVLWGIWSVFGVEPPAAANPFSLVCGLVQLALLAAALARVRDRDGRLLPVWVGLLALAVVVGNRTFLQWLSSGLDTALFAMWLIAWTLHACRGPERRGGAWLAIWSVLAALAALTRPDGLPLVGATAAVAAWHALRKQVSWHATVIGLTPLLLVVAQTVWRRAFYGEWLPNTYFAKVVSAWPEAGARYFACFALENGAWLWLPVVVAWLAVVARHPLAATSHALARHLPAAAAVATVLFNACYYLFRVGGDHFEYRVLSHLVPLGTIACVAMAARLRAGPALPTAVAIALGVAGSAGWVHLAITNDAAAMGVKPVTPAMPAFVRPLTRWFDRQQMWLFARYVGLRCVHHDLVLQLYESQYPPRGPIATAAEPFPVLATGAVGVPSWRLTDCAILDEFGLNDWVIARTPSSQREAFAPAAIADAVAKGDADGDGWLTLAELRGGYARLFGTDPNDAAGDFVWRFLIASHEGERAGAVTAAEAIGFAAIVDASRRMAHERVPPAAYLAAFEPNVVVAGGVATVKPRRQPLTPERIRAIEAEWRDRVRRGLLPR